VTGPAARGHRRVATRQPPPRPNGPRPAGPARRRGPRLSRCPRRRKPSSPATISAAGHGDQPGPAAAAVDLQRRAPSAGARNGETSITRLAQLEQRPRNSPSSRNTTSAAQPASTAPAAAVRTWRPTIPTSHPAGRHLHQRVAEQPADLPGVSVSTARGHPGAEAGQPASKQHGAGQRERARWLPAQAQPAHRRWPAPARPCCEVSSARQPEPGLHPRRRRRSPPATPSSVARERVGQAPFSPPSLGDQVAGLRAVQQAA